MPEKITLTIVTIMLLALYIRTVQGFFDMRKYYQSAHWKRTARKRKKIDNYTCQKCGAKSNLHTHHKNYKRLYSEKMSDLVTLCADCHRKLHEKNKRYKLFKNLLK